MANLASERALFEACLAETGPAQDRLLADAAAEDPDLAARVRRLLLAHAQTRDLMVPVPPHAPELPPEAGDYELLRVIGEGGMGVVWEAEQKAPVQRRVALKVVRSGLSSGKIAQRFASERQALAAMNHPGIAQIFAAGATTDGRPFFAMELIDGLPVTRFCDERRLPLHSRVELVIEICAALEHAHQKGLIHRDLKPSNILVSMRDGKPAPKIIDFGIAKAADDSRNTIEVLGTPDYMSPEQASGQDLDTRTDIYALGVLLYQILAGALPLERGEAGLAEYLKRLSDPLAEAPPPSRRTTPERARELEGDLDWIVLKAIRRDRAARYPTASALAEDLQRFLDSEPVHARPPSFAYRASRFAQRHRPLLAMGLFAALAVALGIAGLAAGLREAGRQAERARGTERQALTLLRTSLIEQARALRSSGSTGRRHRSLELLSRAASISPGTDVRDEAVASLLLTDLRVTAQWSAGGRPVTGLAFSPTLNLQAVGQRGGAVEISRGIPGVPFCRLTGPGGEAWGLRFSRDGRRLAGRFDDGAPPEDLVVWDVETCREIRRFRRRLAATTFDFSPDGRVLLFATWDGHLHRVDLDGADRDQDHLIVSGPIDLRLNASGDLVAIASFTAQMVEIREVATGQLRHRLQAGTGVFQLDWSSDGARLLLALEDGTARIASLDGAWIQRLAGHQAEVVRAYLHPYLPLALTYAWDETTRLWDTDTGEQLLVENKRAFGFSLDGRRISYQQGSELGVWDVLHGGAATTLHGHTGKSPLAVSLLGASDWMASAGADGAIVWDLRQSRAVRHIDAGPLRDLAMLAQDDILACGQRGLVRWRGNRGVTLVPEPCRHLAVDLAGGVALAVLETRDVYRYETAGETAERLPERRPRIGRPSLAPGANLAVAGNWRGDRTVLFDTRTGALRHHVLEGETSVNAAFHPGGQWFVTGTTTEYRAWNTAGFGTLWRAARSSNWSNLPGMIAFPAQGGLVAVELDPRTVELRAMPSGERRGAILLPTPQAISDIAFSADGKYLALATTARRILVWNFAEVEEELRPYGLGAR